ncbi:MAG: inositol monophosphatase family protein [Thermoanaerobaculia bacterium]
MSFAEELRVAIEAAEAGGAAALARFRRPVGVWKKTDASPVTEADLASEAAILGAIERTFPDDGFMSEESGERPAANGRRWLVDPIDGTLAFLRGLPHWGVLVAFESGGRVEAGVAHFPALATTYAAASGEGCWRNGERVRCSDVASFPAATIQIGEAASIRERDPRLFDAIIGSGATIRCYGDAYAACLVLDGRSDGWIECARTWDFAPFAVLAREAGARFTDWSGAESIDGGTAILATPRLHDLLRALVSP